MKKKLIEVALPLEAINKESIRENYIYRGNPSAIHKWWAQRPLAACRAVLFASIVDDPSSNPEDFPTRPLQDKERKRLFDLMERLVVWENSESKLLLDQVRQEIHNATKGKPPVLLDPFAGGGSIPLEGQRLGLTVQTSDLNPIAVLTTKAIIEFPQLVSGFSPINPDSRG
jgi:putative DNA methylase